MSLFTIADLHLSKGVEKPMDIFGGRWQGYMEKIEKNWLSVIKDGDTVVLGGDISWGIDFKQSLEDFKFLNSLPGKKIILKGNHDLWWNTMRKMTNFILENEFENIEFLFNNFFMYENIAICGTRGWFFEEDFKESHDEKIFKRELLRLENSLMLAKKQNPEQIFCFLHYPPLYTNFYCKEIIEIMKKYEVSHCFYGHLHSESLKYAVEGMHENIEFKLVSSDYMNFVPLLLKK